MTFLFVTSSFHSRALIFHSLWLRKSADSNSRTFYIFVQDIHNSAKAGIHCGVTQNVLLQFLENVGPLLSPKSQLLPSTNCSHDLENQKAIFIIYIMLLWKAEPRSFWQNSMFEDLQNLDLYLWQNQHTTVEKGRQHHEEFAEHLALLRTISSCSFVGCAVPVEVFSVFVPDPRVDPSWSQRSSPKNRNPRKDEANQIEYLKCTRLCLFLGSDVVVPFGQEHSRFQLEHLQHLE